MAPNEDIEAGAAPKPAAPGKGADQPVRMLSSSSTRLSWLMVVLALGYSLDVYMFMNYHAFCMVKEDSVITNVNAFFFCSVFNARFVFVSLLPPADDMAVTRVVVCWDISVILGTMAIDMYYLGFDYLADGGAANYALSLIMVGFWVWALLSASTLDAQNRIWLGFRVANGGLFAYWGTCVTTQIFRDHRLPCKLGFVLSLTPMLYISFRPAMRRKLQGRFQVWMEGRVSRRSAASLASLIGSVSPGEAMREARRLFRCIHYVRFEAGCSSDDVLDSVRSMPVQPCSLGSCDAFVSSSPADDQQAKWKALQAWGAAFAERSGREPLLFVPQAGESEAGDDADLRCLPIFLSGSRHLVVLCGPTYLGCLWCILVIFIHCHIGGKAENIELVPVLREGLELEDAQAIEHAFDTFDATDCQCCQPSDMRQMVSIVEATCGSMDAFNISMRGILEKVRLQSSLRPSANCATPSSAGVASDAMLFE